MARSRDLGSGRALITVASELTDGRTWYLTVPVARDAHGGLDVFDLPAMSAPPVLGVLSVTAAAPLSGPDAGEIRGLVRRFLAAYLSGGDLGYLVAPGAAISAMSGEVRLGSVDQIGQVTGGAGRMVVEAVVEGRDRVTRARYPLAYRLELARAGRWFITGIEGGPRS